MYTTGNTANMVLPYWNEIDDSAVSVPSVAV